MCGIKEGLAGEKEKDREKIHTYIYLLVRGNAAKLSISPKLSCIMQIITCIQIGSWQICTIVFIVFVITDAATDKIIGRG